MACELRIRRHPLLGMSSIERSLVSRVMDPIVRPVHPDGVVAGIHEEAIASGRALPESRRDPNSARGTAKRQSAKGIRAKTNWS